MTSLLFFVVVSAMTTLYTLLQLVSNLALLFYAVQNLSAEERQE